MLNENDFNLTDDLSIATIQGDSEHVEAEIITDPSQFEEMSLSVQKKNKEALANMKTRVMYALDKKKLNEAQKIFSSLENIGDIFSDPEVMRKVRGTVSTAQDLKFLSEAYSRLIDSNQKLMRLDSVDGQGNAAKLNLAVQFTSPSGNSVNAVIQAEG